MTVAVVLPFRPGDEHRNRAYAWAERWWQTTFPDWLVITSYLAGDGPWCKALPVSYGVRDAVRQGADVVVIADADVYVPGVSSAVGAVLGGTAWAMPHLRVYRLGQTATAAFIDSGHLPPLQRVKPPRGGWPDGDRPIVESHRGEVGGGCVVLPADLYRRVPLDPRFLGWGQEDVSWGCALTVLAGAPWRVPEPLWHLWHPPPERAATDDPHGYTRRTRAVGNIPGRDLYRRYRDAKTPAAITALLAEYASMYEMHDGGSAAEGR